MSKYSENDSEDRDETGHRPFSIENLNRILAILFVLSTYLFIFLKIMVLE